MRRLWFVVGLAIPAAVVALLLGFRGPNLAGAHVERFTLHSRLVHRDLHEVLAFARAHGLRLRVSPGGHSGSYWKPHMAAYLRFYAQALRSCRR